MHRFAFSQRIYSFTISLATFTSLVNDEKTRSFLTAEIGHGYDEVSLTIRSLLT